MNTKEKNQQQHITHSGVYRDSSAAKNEDNRAAANAAPLLSCPSKKTSIPRFGGAPSWGSYHLEVYCNPQQKLHSLLQPLYTQETCAPLLPLLLLLLLLVMVMLMLQIGAAAAHARL